MTCAELSVQEHAVYQALAAAGLSRTGTYRTSVERLATSLGQTPKSIRESLEGLADVRFVLLGANGVIEAIESPCPCRRPKSPEGTSTPPRDMTFPSGTPEPQSFNSSKALNNSIASGSSDALYGAEGPGESERPPVRARASGRGRKRRKPNEVYALAEHFKSRLVMDLWGKAPGGSNSAALRKHFKEWMTDYGIPAEDIRSMIDLFTSDDSNLRPGIPAWKSFINLRQRLFDDVQRSKQAVRIRVVSVEEQKEAFGTRGMRSRGA